MSSLLAAAPFGANLILGVFILVAAVGLVFGYFTFMGSGINNHPVDGSHAPPGSKLPDEFHMFADRQVHDAELREADIERRVDARLARAAAEGPKPERQHAIRLHVPRRHPEDDMSLEEANRRLAAEASARKAATEERTKAR
jgi:hypothetical protein